MFQGIMSKILWENKADSCLEKVRIIHFQVNQRMRKRQTESKEKHRERERERERQQGDRNSLLPNQHYLQNYFLMQPLVAKNLFNVYYKNSQIWLQRPPLGPQISGCCTEVVGPWRFFNENWYLNQAGRTKSDLC